jgi:hypothetical protein
MGERSGVGLVELAILEALDARGAGPRGRHVKCLKVLLAMEDEIGLARGYGYQVLVDLTQTWKLPIPLVDGHGNFGSPDDEPASAYYTEARLSPAGQVALAAERGEIAPVPIGLINGNTHRQGTRPPYRPAAIIDAVRQIRRRPKLTASQINAIIGPPDFITGCTVTGDLAALKAGRRGELGLQARALVTDAAYVNARVAKAAIPGNDEPYWPGAAFPVVVLDRFAPYANPHEILLSIRQRARSQPWRARYPELAEQAALPVREAADHSDRFGNWHVYVPAAEDLAEELRTRLLKVRGVTYYISVGLPKPLATMIRTWTRTHEHEDLDASLTALENALARA